MGRPEKRPRGEGFRTKKRIRGPHHIERTGKGTAKQDNRWSRLRWAGVGKELRELFERRQGDCGIDNNGKRENGRCSYNHHPEVAGVNGKNRGRTMVA